MGAASTHDTELALRTKELRTPRVWGASRVVCRACHAPFHSLLIFVVFKKKKRPASKGCWVSTNSAKVNRICDGGQDIKRSNASCSF